MRKNPIRHKVRSYRKHDGTTVRNHSRGRGERAKVPSIHEALEKIENKNEQEILDTKYKIACLNLEYKYNDMIRELGAFYKGEFDNAEEKIREEERGSKVPNAKAFADRQIERKRAELGNRYISDNNNIEENYRTAKDYLDKIFRKGKYEKEK